MYADEQFLGKWFQHRWYYYSGFNPSWALEDYTLNVFKEEGSDLFTINITGW